MSFKMEKNNINEILNVLETKGKKALFECGLKAETYAKENCPVDTGFLRNSITFALSGEGTNISSYSDDAHTKSGSYAGIISDTGEMQMVLGSNVEYAPYIEFGTGRGAESGGRQTAFAGGFGHGGRPFIRPAISDHVDMYKKIMQSNLR